MRNNGAVMAVVVMAWLAAASAAAQGQNAPQNGEEGVEDKALVGAGTAAYDPERAFFGPLPRYTTRDGNLSVGAGLVLDFDAGHYRESDTRPGTAIDKVEDGARDRRAVLSANALLFKDFMLFGSWNFTDRDDRFSDGLRSFVLIYRGFDPWWIRVGQHSLASPLDAARGVRAFMEESMSSGAFGYAPGTPSLGASVSHRGAHHNVRLGVWSVSVKEFGSDREGYGVHGRASYAPIAGRTRALHFGVAGYWRKPTVVEGEASGGERFAARPELRVDNDGFVVDTGRIGHIDSFHYTAIELAGVYGRWSFQGELQRVGIDRGQGPAGSAYPDLSFSGYYALGSYFLTGESRNYYQRLGSFWRVSPHRAFDPWGSGGWGAFEVAARVSRVDLDDETRDFVGGVRGGVSDNVSLALNWYFNAYVRLSLNYVHAEVDNLDEQGQQEGGTVDGLGMRLRWEF